MITKTTAAVTIIDFVQLVHFLCSSKTNQVPKGLQHQRY